MSEIRAAIPNECFERSLTRSLAYTAMSLALTGATGLAAWQLLPLTWAWSPLWVAYAVVAGTFAVGAWVVAHECGHGAFCENDRVQNTVGLVLHSALLVPYFSWQRSHAVHHANTNHVVLGETHVPPRVETPSGSRMLATRAHMGRRTHASLTLVTRLIFGWPAYMIAGTTGGPDRGATNHFWPWAPFSNALFPRRWTKRVLISSLGVLTTLAVLTAWAVAAGSVIPVLALYVGPYLVTNAWIVAYTWLHHTDTDIPHFDDPEWSFVRGAFCSVDRPYGRVVDLLHHHIGSTHAAHHLLPKIPHYHAAVATEALAEAFPEHYRYDPTPVPAALWRIADKCVAVAPSDDGWRFVDEAPHTA